MSRPIDLTGKGPRTFAIGGGGGGAGIKPFALANASEPGVPQVSVYVGSVNTLDPEDDGPFAVDNDPPVIEPATDGKRIYVDLTVSYDAPTGVWSATSFEVSSGASLPAPTTSHAYYLIGMIGITEDVMTITQNVQGNIGWRRCGITTSYVDDFWLAP